MPGSDDEESVNQEFDLEVDDDDDDDNVELIIDPDSQYQNECGYWIIMMFRGQSTGRKLKKDVAKISIVQFICGIALLANVQKSRDSVQLDHFLSDSKYAYPCVGIMWLVGVISLGVSVIAFYAIRQWSSIVTNRSILACVIKFYYIICFFLFWMSIGCLIGIFLGFRHVNWRTNEDAEYLLPFFQVSIIFLLPYVWAHFIYGMNIWYLSDEIEYGGSIAEPGNPKPMIDLSHLTVQDSCIFFCAMPIGALIQFYDLVMAVWHIFVRLFCGLRGNLLSWDGWFGSKSEYGSDDEETGGLRIKGKRKRRSFFVRLWRTIWKMFSPKPAPVTVTEEQPLNKLEQRLKALRAKREDNDKQAREQFENEEQIKEKIERDIENERLAALERERLVKLEEEQRKAAEDASSAAKPVIEPAKLDGDGAEAPDKESVARTLTVGQYKALWSSLEASGSFQCGLKEQPTMHKLSDHMRKQGFHIVFASTGDKRASNPSANSSVGSSDTANMTVTTSPVNAHVDMELGICNVRESGGGPWFLARFLVAGGAFSAVMKCQEADKVPAFVKKFSLAKVLKIDASGGTR